MAGGDQRGWLMNHGQGQCSAWPCEVLLVDVVVHDQQLLVDVCKILNLRILEGTPAVVDWIAKGASLDRSTN